MLLLPMYIHTSWLVEHWHLTRLVAMPLTFLSSWQAYFIGAVLIVNRRCCYDAYLIFQKWFYFQVWRRMYDEYHTVLGGRKKEFFRPIMSQVSADPQLRQKNAIRILEIGAGAGANFELFPTNCDLIITEPNEHFKPLIDKNYAKSQHKGTMKYIACPAETLCQVPDASVDVVVSTLVLGNTRSVNDTLAEIQRVLAPGGRYFYWENIHAEEHTWLHLWQRVVWHCRVWYIFMGCRLDKPTDRTISQHPGFSKVEQSCFYHNVGPGWYLNSYTLTGVATK